jgi:hypothetical protein
VATLTTTNAQLQEQLRAASAAAEPLNAKIAELNTENTTLREQQGAPRSRSEGEIFKTPFGSKYYQYSILIEVLEELPISKKGGAGGRRRNVPTIYKGK